MNRIRGILALGAALVLAGVLAVAAEPASQESSADPGKASAESTTFEMTEISLFDKSDLKDDVRAMLTCGSYTGLTNAPDKEVRAYPKLHSKRPMYGVATFSASMFDRRETIKRYFVLDQSEGEAEPAEEKSSSFLEGIVDALSGQPRRSSPPVKYDRLYFDVNGDGDLTNDAPVGLMKDPPAALPRQQNSAIFDVLEVLFDYGPGLGQRPLTIVPQLIAEGQDRGYIGFIVPVGRMGAIRLGQREYTAILTQPSVTGRFDRPETSLRLLPKDGKEESYVYWSHLLGTMREIDGQLYDISATPLGDQLTVTPYKGPMGTIEITPGDGSTGKGEFSGLLYAERRLVVLGNIQSRGDWEKSPRFELPAGDYAPVFLSLDLGQLRFSLRPNAYREGDATYHVDWPVNRCIHICEGEPYVLDFREKPKVLFTTPAKDQMIGPGEDVQVQALLIEPRMNLILTGLQDKTKEDGWVSGHDKDGNEVKIPQYKSVVPTVAIKDSSGKHVAQGDMPFG